MKKLSFFSLTLLCTTLLVFSACKKDQVEELATQPADTITTTEAYYYTPALEDLWTEVAGRSAWTTIPAGSVDMLNQAIANASPWGIIYLEAGLHTETERVTVNKPLKIIGADGAVLEIQSIDDEATTNPAIHIKDAGGTALQNIEIMAYGEGAVTAILFDNSPESALLKSKVTGFVQGVIIEKSDRVAIINNAIEGLGSDQSLNGILVNRGKSTYIGWNDISGFDLGTWSCDQWGTSEQNTYHDNNAGLLLCKYNELFGATIPGSADPIGATSAQGWKIRNNMFAENIEGISVRDGSNLNLIVANNQYSNNSNYDIIIPADEDIPNFLFIPEAFNNTIHAAPGVIIKNCTTTNTVFGGTLVDTNQDPC